MDDDSGFLRWFVPWKASRPDMTPIGWYTLADLETAFNAGMAATDGRPGRSSLPPEEAQTRDAPGRAGPCPTREEREFQRAMEEANDRSFGPIREQD